MSKELYFRHKGFAKLTSDVRVLKAIALKDGGHSYPGGSYQGWAGYCKACGAWYSPTPSTGKGAGYQPPGVDVLGLCEGLLASGV